MKPYTCRRCGKVFQANKVSALCPDCRTGHCVICGTEFVRDSNQVNRETCCRKCAGIWRIQSGSAKNAAEKAKATMTEKYGGVGLASPVLRERAAKTNNERYGADLPFQSDEIQAKVIESTTAKYGVKCVLELPEMVEKRKQACRDLYGTEIPAQSKKGLEQIQKTNLERYGHRFSWQNPEIRQRWKDSMNKKYGAPSWFESDDRLIYNMTDPSKLEEFKLFKSDPKKYIESNFQDKPTFDEISERLGVCYTSVTNTIVRSGYQCQDLIRYQKSKLEDTICEFLNSIIPAAEIIRDCRSVISPKELDIYLPEFNLGIECDPTYTHNSTYPSFTNHGDPLPSTYHQNKSLDCLDHNIFCFHIFGWEWAARKDIILSMIRNLVSACDQRYYGRNLEVDDVDFLTCTKFLNDNHRQGSLSSNVRLGLYTKDTYELISMMTFNRMRPGIGKKSSDSDNTWELSRFCSKLNTSVVGGASKLFKHFVKKYNPDKVVSFSDLAHTKGTLYQQLGFDQVSMSAPGYVWVNTATDAMLSRERCQKRNLPKLFNEPDLDIEQQTEKEIMMNHGYVQVFDSGIIRWEWQGLCSPYIIRR